MPPHLSLLEYGARTEQQEFICISARFLQGGASACNCRDDEMIHTRTESSSRPPTGLRSMARTPVVVPDRALPGREALEAAWQGN